MTTIRDEALEGIVLERLAALADPYCARATADHTFDREVALEALGELAELVAADLRAVACVEDVATNLLETGADGELTLVVTVRVGPRHWLPTMNVRVTPYRGPRGEA